MGHPALAVPGGGKGERVLSSDIDIVVHVVSEALRRPKAGPSTSVGMTTSMEIELIYVLTRSLKLAFFWSRMSPFGWAQGRLLATWVLLDLGCKHHIVADALLVLDGRILARGQARAPAPTWVLPAQARAPGPTWVLPAPDSNMGTRGLESYCADRAAGVCARK